MKRSVVFTVGLLLVVLWASQGMVYAEEYVLWSDTTQGKSYIPKKCKKVNGTHAMLIIKNNSDTAAFVPQEYEYLIHFSFDGKKDTVFGVLKSHEAKCIGSTDSGAQICTEGGHIANDTPGHPKLRSFQIIVRTE